MTSLVEAPFRRRRQRAHHGLLVAGLATSTAAVSAASWAAHSSAYAVAGRRQLHQDCAAARTRGGGVFRRLLFEAEASRPSLAGISRFQAAAVRPRRRPSFVTAFAAQSLPSPSSASSDPAEFDKALIAQLEALQGAQFLQMELEEPADTHALELRQRIAEVRRDQSQSVVSEMLRMHVLDGLDELQVPLLRPLRFDATDEALEEPGAFGNAELRRLATSLYSEDAVDIVREHVMDIIGRWDHLVRDHPLQLALFQVGQVYWMSALFGYALRKADTRYRLERLASKGVVKVLRDYISPFEPSKALIVASAMSAEAQLSLEQQVTGLYGDLGRLQQQLVEAVGPHLGIDEAASKLRESISSGEVESGTLTISGLRRATLEGVAYGYLLNKAETKVDPSYEFTPGPGDSEFMYLGARSQSASSWGPGAGRSFSGYQSSEGHS
mmetsp:Transcript_80348/g.145040  ORF Transcript_80348/g.145040 Transcript_80348/m.145040 type:complete len:440 (-) Transcript_80348:311-1630(-)